MRLYLSSFKIGKYPERLVELVGTGSNVAIILNALDYKEESRKKFLLSETEVFSGLGFRVIEIDLRKYFGKKEELENLLRSQDLVWVTGGNTFLLRRAMKQSGFDEVITKILKEDSIVYAGFSAGCVVLHKNLHGLEITDSPLVLATGYNTEIEWSGLGLLEFAIAVHYDSDHSESEETNEEIEFYKKNNIPFEPLRDGEVIIIKGEKKEILR